MAAKQIQLRRAPWFLNGVCCAVKSMLLCASSGVKVVTAVRGQRPEVANGVHGRCVAEFALTTNHGVVPFTDRLENCLKIRQSADE